MEVFVSGVSAGTASVVAGGAWTLSGVDPLVIGQRVEARATATGKGTSALSTPVFVIARSGRPTLDIFGEGDVAVSGAAPGGAGTQVDIYIDGQLVGTATAGAGGTYSLALGGPLVVGEAVVAIAREPGKAPSFPSLVRIVLPRTESPIVDGPILVSATEVSGTSTERDGTQIRVCVNSVQIGAIAVSSGTWRLTGVGSLVNGDRVTAFALAAGKVLSFESQPVRVGAVTTAVPVISAPVVNGDIRVRGISGEADGTVVEVIINGVSAGTTLVSGGLWTLNLSALITGQSVQARATASGKGTSAWTRPRSCSTTARWCARKHRAWSGAWARAARV